MSDEGGEAMGGGTGIVYDGRCWIVSRNLAE
jgi:hypothetical protein